MALGRWVRGMPFPCAVSLALLSATARTAALDQPEDAEPPSATSCTYVEASETDAALGALAHLIHIVFDAPEALDRPSFGHDHVVTDDALGERVA